ncbi:MAG: NAD(P)-dependent oxidoreductase [Polaromonas sp.]|uniref:NAD(P)-dependent oxidoreductase n=1 Tax=Polaromonas sp. TaxID=1869339 RepID=UPI002488FAF4|nr:NAD(P)-dependent oxidoreductase [Polaromonas sp.]MDI1271913.1 NAD(P)-dependent oxidoreductase [Polaromonas sp.]
MSTPLSPKTVSIIGTGNMGGAMAANLLARGWAVQVCDIDPVKVADLEEKWASALAVPAQAAINSVAFIVCVVDAAQTDAVLFGPDGLARMLQPGHTVMLCPTISPQDVEAFAGRLAALGVHTVDAPMSGGPARARDGSMSLMVACAPAVYEQQADLLQALSGKVFRISDRPGDGARTKLVNNLLAGINLVGAAEVLALAGRLGLDPGRTLDVIEQSSGQSWIGSDRMRRAIAGDYAPRAHLTLLEKDTRLAVEAARAAGFEGPLGARASDVFSQAHRAGLAALDDAAIFKYLADR